MYGDSVAGQLSTGDSQRWNLTLDNRGRLRLPKALRLALGIVPGDIVTVALDGHAASLRSIDESIRQAQPLVQARVTPGRSLFDDLLAERVAEE